MKLVTDEVLSHLGGNYDENDPATFTNTVWDFVIDKFSIKSILDLGSGYGYASQYFSNKGILTIAVDGLQYNVENSVYPTILHDLTAGPIGFLVDLVHCQEVVEHIEEKYLDNLLQSLTCGQYLLMTNALPKQDGYHHVNCQEIEYWTEHLNKYHFELLEDDSAHIRNLGKNNNNPYMAQTGCLYIKSK
jgi:hypothetical protein